MTVRAKTEIYRALNAQNITAVWVKSTIVGELQIQAVGYDGEMQTVFIPSSVGVAEPRLVNLIGFASASSWRASRSLMAAVRAGHITVTLKKD